MSQLTITDMFCGAGGSSSGLVEAGYRVVIAANHWARAIESHQLNHPETDHSQADISRAQTLLGYVPTHRIREGLSQALDWYIGTLAREAPPRSASTA